jgi:hypothetical protein
MKKKHEAFESDLAAHQDRVEQVTKTFSVFVTFIPAKHPSGQCYKEILFISDDGSK